MVWFKVDDGFHQHPKALRAGNAALGLWVRCGAYCSQYETDGMIPTQVAAQYGTRREIDRLVTAGLWMRVDGGYRMPDFLDYNPAHSDLEMKRKLDRERKRQQQ
jgi:hypothetical protein